MELAAKIIFFLVSWYAIGFAGMYYFRWELNKELEPGKEYHEVKMREVYVLALLGLIVILHIVWNNIYVWWYERKLPNNRK